MALRRGEGWPEMEHRERQQQGHTLTAFIPEWSVERACWLSDVSQWQDMFVRSLLPLVMMVVMILSLKYSGLYFGLEFDRVSLSLRGC